MFNFNVYTTSAFPDLSSLMFPKHLMNNTTVPLLMLLLTLQSIFPPVKNLSRSRSNVTSSLWDSLSQPYLLLLISETKNVSFAIIMEEGN